MSVWSQEGALGRVTFDRPDRLNAWDQEMGRAVRDALTTEAADPGVRAVLVSGEGRAFSAGADLDTGFVEADDGRPEIEAVCREVFDPLILGLRELPKPVVAAVQGPAAGFGASVALACDLLLMAESSFLELSFVKVGLMPDGGTTMLVPAAVGKSRAFRMAMLGERVPAAQALEWGLADAVHPDDELAGAAEELAERLAAGPTLAYAAAKAALNRTLYAGLADQLAHERGAQHRLARTEDFAEGTLAFTEKRPPRFAGE